ncbi:GGDEF domain-containing protein [Aquirhabdus parva]|uniref:diguanylate cyclase n=1 Tax=Aquirhabdus parva TaxID=2283318 RepID=A0A345P2I2_9GAMM|nr:GGDEF domain-containing protein [Aquirhabdus parva]AXI01491.1 GGDEF domain-containing protein [Aquirhabdus parva]
MKYFTPPSSYSETEAQGPEVCRNGIAIQQTFHHIKKRHSFLRKRLVSILEWSRVDKGIFILVMLTPYFLQYFLWSGYVVNHSELHGIVNISVLNSYLWIQTILVVIGCGILGFGLVMRRRKPDAVFFQYLVLQFFSLSMIAMFYYVGPLSFSAGLFLLGAPVWGLILLDRKPVWWATGIAVTALLGLGYAAAYNVFPHASLMIPPTDQAGRVFWMNSTVYFNALFFILILVMADQMLAWWHAREDNIRELSRTDALTGVHNRLSILDFLNHEVARTVRMNTPLSVVILDLDHFKRVNDDWGHPVGDLVLQRTAEVLQQNIRDIDALGRYGGEEFIIVLPGADHGEALNIIERCRIELARAEILTESNHSIRVTASFGFVCVSGLQIEPHVLIKTADQALYAAKSNGRNRVESMEVSSRREEVLA